MLDSSLLLSALTKSYLSIRQGVREEEGNREWEREREPVASCGLCSQISIRLMSLAPGLLPPLLMLLPREGGEIGFAEVWL